jgi:phosphatidylserine decarboxylase
MRQFAQGARPIDPASEHATFPCDALHLVFPKITIDQPFDVKGHPMHLNDLLAGNQQWIDTYEGGSMMISRLRPEDYHRCHFPVDCTISETKELKGYLDSVHPIALERDPNILCKNQRMITVLHTQQYGDIAYIEVGALFVGSIFQNTIAGQTYTKGEEKSNFSFGGSTVILLFPPNTVQFVDELCTNSQKSIETKCKVGQTFGKLIPCASSPV